MTCAKAFMKGDWKNLWNGCRSQGVARQDKLAQAPQTATTRSTKQMDFLAQKYALTGNLLKASQTICSTLKPALKLDIWTNSRPKPRRTPLILILVTGWRPREQIAWMLNDRDEMFHDLICAQLILP